AVDFSLPLEQQLAQRNKVLDAAAADEAIGRAESGELGGASYMAHGNEWSQQLMEDARTLIPRNIVRAAEAAVQAETEAKEKAKADKEAAADKAKAEK